MESIIELESRLQTVQTSLVLEHVCEEDTRDNDLSLSRIHEVGGSNPNIEPRSDLSPTTIEFADVYAYSAILSLQLESRVSEFEQEVSMKRAIDTTIVWRVSTR